MRHFKYVLDYLRTAIKEGATYTARTYADELGQLYDGQEAQLKLAQEASTKHAKTILEQSAEILKLRDAIETMREQRSKEKALKIGEWYGAGGSFGDVVQKGKPIVFGGIDWTWQECPPDPRYNTPNTKTPDHTWRANPDKKWETSYTKRVVDALRGAFPNTFRSSTTWRGGRALIDAVELLTDYHSTMHEVYEERDAALKTSTDTALAVVALNERLDWKTRQHEAALTSMGPLNQRISDLIKERDVASANVKARIRDYLGLVVS